MGFPYNPMLLRRFQSHINVEVSTLAKMLKYLFKYVHKGPDCATAVMKNDPEYKKDEIKHYVDSRYISAAEAAWILFDLSLHN